MFYTLNILMQFKKTESSNNLYISRGSLQQNRD